MYVSHLMLDRRSSFGDNVTRRGARGRTPRTGRAGLGVRTRSGWRTPSCANWSVRLILVAVVALAGVAWAFEPQWHPTLDVKPRTGEIVIDGDLSDPGWRDAAKADGFAETSPGDQVEPPYPTEVLMTYDESDVYFAFICHDDPATIHATLCDRDNIYSDDYVGILFDTFGDFAWAYEIFFNPYGIQGDLRMLSNGNEDMSFEMIFYSKGKITPDGYQVEARIPLRSLRFPSKPEQVWRATFWRNRPRESRERSSWAAINRDESCWMCQWGTITGIRNITPGHNIEVLPSLIGYQTGARSDFENPGSKFDNSNPDGEAAVNLKYGLGADITAEVAVNPDFSQVESDAEEIDVNNTFTLFYPERRPFFQRGSDLFSTWIDAIYTRSINDPQYAAKLTGRVKKTSFAYIGAVDQNSWMILPFEESDEIVSVKKSYSNIARVRQSLWGDSYLGGLVTDRRYEGDGAGSVIGVDGRMRLDRNWLLAFQGVASHTQELNDTALTPDLNGELFDSGRHTAALDGENYWGHGAYLHIDRSARAWWIEAEYSERSPTFRTDNGGETGNDYRLATTSGGYIYQTDTPLLDEIGTSFELARKWNFRDIRRDEWWITSLWCDFKAQTSINFTYLRSRELFRGVDLPGIRSYQIYLNSRFSKPVEISGNVNWGWRVARSLDVPLLGKQLGYSLSAAIRPQSRLLIEPTYTRARMLHPADNSEIYNGYIFRTRLSYQFTREWFLRLVVQYHDFRKDLSVEPLLTYRLNPFTVFYLGSSLAYHDYGEEVDFASTSRQYFFKLQYLFRL